MSVICKGFPLWNYTMSHSRKLSTICSGCMKIRIRPALRLQAFINLQRRFFSSEELSPVSSLTVEQAHKLYLPKKFRCENNDPADHSMKDIGLFYTIPQNEFKVLSPDGISSKAFDKKSLEEFHAFNEASMMIRKPSIEILNYLKHADYSLPVQRYLIYGDFGTGKSYTLQHVTHYCSKYGWLIVPIFNAWDWMLHRSKHKQTQLKELSESQWNNDRYDQPDRAVAWLEVFKRINKQHLANIKTSKDYIWTKREKTDAGSSLGALVDQGIARTRLATDAIGCIMREIRVQGPETMPRTLVAIDCVNALFASTNLKVSIEGYVNADELAFVINLKKLMSNTWTNGAVVCAMSCIYTTPLRRGINIRDATHTYKVLGHEGFDALDPHIPVEVENYTHEEILSQLAYYEDRKWLTEKAMTDEGRQEIIQLSGTNPVELAKVCNTLN
ncbi:small ribosomal subunit protein mS29-like [Styela clava]